MKIEGAEAVDGGCLVASEHLDGQVFVLDGPWRDSYARHFQNGALGLRLNALYWKAEPLAFVASLAPTLKSLEVYSDGVKDISVLSDLPHVQHVGLVCPFRRFDFASLGQLRVLAGKWRPGCETALALPDLETLSLEGYPYADVSALEGLGQLRSLHLTSRKLTSLAGAEHLRNLRRLTLSDCPQLASLEALAGLDALENLELYACKQVTDLAPLAQLPLTRLMMECNGGRVDSVAPLAALVRLRELYLIGIAVADDNLAPLQGLPLERLAMKNSKRYRPPLSELRSKLGLG